MNACKHCGLPTPTARATQCTTCAELKKQAHKSSTYYAVAPEFDKAHEFAGEQFHGFIRDLIKDAIAKRNEDRETWRKWHKARADYWRAVREGRIQGPYRCIECSRTDCPGCY